MTQDGSGEPRETAEAERGGEIAALEILGTFLSFFGLALIVAVFFAGPSRVAIAIGGLEVTTAQLANLVCGLLILGIGAALFLGGRAIRRRRAAAARIRAPNEGNTP